MDRDSRINRIRFETEIGNLEMRAMLFAPYAQQNLQNQKSPKILDLVAHILGNGHIDSGLEQWIYFVRNRK